MSDLAEKLEQRRPSHDGKATATRKQLLARYGAKQQDERTVVIDTMGGREVWRRVGAGGDVFEQEVRT